uniref:hypothetical protein 57 n=1 Tax=Moniliophthora perniciosa TaxID=153609 RepID=UPI0000242374|nr:hypothetical protein 57 [Moniliophthora perniciosa]AAQ74329.1 hypothetical protein 57 [Moniliophthora perniciosa]
MIVVLNSSITQCYFLHNIMLKFIHRKLIKIFFYIYMFISEPKIFFNKLQGLVISLKNKIISFFHTTNSFVNIMYNSSKPYIKYFSLIGKIIQFIINITFGGIIIYYNPISDLFENFFNIEIIKNSLNKISIFFSNISNYLNSLINKSNPDIELLNQESKDFEDLDLDSLRKSYNFNDYDSNTLPKGDDNSNNPSYSKTDTSNWSEIGKYCLIISGVIIIGGLVYYNLDGILAHLGYIPKNNNDNFYDSNSNQSLIDLSTPTNSNSNSPSSDQFIRYFKDPNLNSTNSSPISITSELSEISNRTSSNYSTSSSVTIKPEAINVELLSNKPEEIIIKSVESPSPKKILLRISEETLNKLREKGELSPLDKDITD